MSYPDSGWFCELEPREDGTRHVYPLSVSLPDIVHEQPPTVRVLMPLMDCALCQEGTCVQSLLEPGLVVHARWLDD